MVTKIFVSQIDSTNSDGSQAADGAFIKLVGGVAVWSTAAVAGATGFTGSAGSAGPQGASGYVGSLGDSGLVGPMGQEGYRGSVGDAGPGFKGSRGDIGYVGSPGVSTPGYQGSLGNPGFQGSAATGGFRGSTGFAGSAGTGFVGSAGSAGFVGSAGGAGGGFPFNYLTDLSPNTYPTRANYIVKVNSSATGVTLVDGNTYVTYTNPAANINFTSNTYLSKAKTSSYGEYVVRVTTPSNSIASITAAVTNIAHITLSPTSGSIVAITLPNDVLATYGSNHYTIILYLKQDATGSRTVDWSNSNVKWPTAEGIPATGPTLSTTPNYTDVLTFTTMDGGASWYGFLAAKGFA